MSCSLSWVLAGHSWMFYQWIILAKIIRDHWKPSDPLWFLWVAIEFLWVFRIPQKLGNTTSLRSGVTANLSDSRGKEVVLAGSIHFKCPCWSHPDHLVALCYVRCTYMPKWKKATCHLRKCDVLAPWFTSILHNHHIISLHIFTTWRPPKKIHLSPNRVKIVYWC